MLTTISTVEAETSASNTHLTGATLTTVGLVTEIAMMTTNVKEISFAAPTTFTPFIRSLLACLFGLKCAKRDVFEKCRRQKFMRLILSYKGCVGYSRYGRIVIS